MRVMIIKCERFDTPRGKLKEVTVVTHFGPLSRTFIKRLTVKVMKFAAAANRACLRAVTSRAGKFKRTTTTPPAAAISRLLQVS